MADSAPDYDLSSCTLVPTGVVELDYVVLNLYQPFLTATLTRGPVELTEQLLRRAYCATCFRHPLLRARRDNDRHRGVLAIPSDDHCARAEHLAGLPVFVHRSSDRESAWGEAMRALSEVWSSSHVFQIDAYLLDAAAEKELSCVLVAHFNHGIGDGTAFVIALSEYLRALNCCGSDGSLPPINCLGEPKAIPQLSLERYPNYFIPDKDAATEEGRAKMLDKCLETLRANEKLLKHHLRDARLTEEQTLGLVSACKAHGVSVTAAVAAALTIASDARSMMCVLPVSLRTEAERNEVSMRFRAMLLTPELDPKAVEGEDLWAVASRFSGSIAEVRGDVDKPYPIMSMLSLQNALMPADASMMRQGMYMMGPDAVSQKRVFLFLSSLGVVDKFFGDCSSSHWRLEDLVLNFSNKHDPIDGGVFAMTFNNRLHIGFADSTPPHEEQAFRAYVSKTVELLASCGASSSQ
eukprot:m51a1_g181 hypothetical protein (465) ;mRNA; r:595995-597389